MKDYNIFCFFVLAWLSHLFCGSHTSSMLVECGSYTPCILSTFGGVRAPASIPSSIKYTASMASFTFYPPKATIIHQTPRREGACKSMPEPEVFSQ